MTPNIIHTMKHTVKARVLTARTDSRVRFADAADAVDAADAAEERALPDPGGMAVTDDMTGSVSMPVTVGVAVAARHPSVVEAGP
jgi:hypothetical protein